MEICQVVSAVSAEGSWKYVLRVGKRAVADATDGRGAIAVGFAAAMGSGAAGEVVVVVDRIHGYAVVIA